MNYLLDTHTFLWFIDKSPEISVSASQLIELTTEDIYLSTASLWEIAIKHSLGKLKLPSPFLPFVTQELQKNIFLLLPIRIPHLDEVAVLPFHHRDPFDRMLIAQAISEDLTIIGADQVFDLYSVKRYW
jgi:PIN domain nuclease of toxin-antitoxin system